MQTNGGLVRAGPVAIGTIVTPTGRPGADAPPVGPPVIVAATAPVGAVVGSLWWDTANIRLMLYLGSWMQI